MAQITYDTKVALNENSSVAAINKVSAADMNEIKTVVNGNDTLMGDLTNLTTTDKTSIVGAINENTTTLSGITSGMVISTTAVKTGEKSVNNKDIYAIAFKFDIGTATSYSVSFSLPTADTAKIWIDNSNSYWYSASISSPVEHFRSSTDWSSFYLTGGGIYCTFGSTYSTISKSAVVVVKYEAS